MGALDDAHLDEELHCAVGLVPGSGSEMLSTREIEDAVKVLLHGLGEDSGREGLKKTPLRVAKAFLDGTRGYKLKVKDIVQGALFPEAGLESATGCAGGVGGLVVVRDMDMFSYCESCLLPFSIRCHVGYIPSGQRVVGLSKLSRVADVFARRLQEPQRLADEISSALQSSINPAGVAVALQCSHIQLPETLNCKANLKISSKLDMQGWVNASVFSSSGVFKNEDHPFWDDFLALLKFKGIHMEETDPYHSLAQSWCPLRSLDILPCNGRNLTNVKFSPKFGVTQTSMIDAVTSIIEALGEDPSREELMGTPSRFIHWLTNFKKSGFEMKLSRNSLHMKTTNGVAGAEQNEMHTELSLPFCSQCEHHLLPFHGVVHVGYFGSNEGEVIQRCILQSLVHFYSVKLQVQERLTRQIAETVYSVLGTGVMVVVEASHTCMISRGIEKVGCTTATLALLGRFSTEPKAKTMFLQAISNHTATG
ncbi:GTP cyclohydrolase I protein [Dioscorea alata]|uniref:GTP cyclohydrolase I protein n=2 Tax=Dioscorea alata TaxID=55571 RepID=A0ACB7UTV7_DIOAL|nr:GTP cyclohydrolase I protein [Dioscorea alata]